MPDLSLVTRKVGPLPLVAWLGIGVGGFVLYRVLTGGGSSGEMPIVPDGFDPDALTGGGGSIGGVNPDGTPIIPIGTVPIGQLQGNGAGPPKPRPGDTLVFPGIDEGWATGHRIIGGRSGGGRIIVSPFTRPSPIVSGTGIRSVDRRRVAVNTVTAPLRTAAQTISTRLR